MSSADLTLLSLWKNERDAAAFKQLTLRHAPMVYATCCRVLGSATEAEDVTQECFEKLAGASGGPEGSLGAWLHKMAVNRARDRIRSDKRRKSREARFAAQRDSHTAPEWDDIYGFVDEAIAALPDKLRVPVVEHFLNDKSHAEIAKQTGMSRQTVTYRVGIGVEAIRKSLKKRGVVATGAAITALMHDHLAEATPLPPSLSGSLGKLALAGPPAPVGAGGTLGGLLSIKGAIIGAAILAALVGVPYVATQRHSATERAELTSSPQVDESRPESETGAVAQEDPRRRVDLQAREVLSGLLEAAGTTPQPGLSITGRVYDAKTGKGIPNVVIEIRGGDTSIFSEPTEATGAYEAKGLSNGQYAVSRTYVEGYPLPKDNDAKTVLVNANGSPVEVDFPLEKGLSVTGVAVDAEGRPLGDVTVHAEGGENGVQPARSSDDGTFEVVGLTEGDEIVLSAVKDFASEREMRSYRYAPVTVNKDGLHGIELVVQDLAHISGRVVDPSGAPVPRAYVQAEAEKLHLAPPPGRQTTEGSASAEEDGSFRIDGLFAGTYQVGFMETGTQQTVKVLPGEEASGLELVYTGERPEDPMRGGTATIAGRVTDQDGNPVAHAIVSASGETDEARWSHAAELTDENGMYNVEGLIDAPHKVTVHHDEYSMVTRTEVMPNGGAVNVQMARRGKIEGLVYSADTKQPIPDFSIGHGPAESFEHIKFESSLVLGLTRLIAAQNMHEPDGRFILKNVEPGDTYVVVRAEGFGPALARVSVLSDRKPSPLTIELLPEARIDGQVVDRYNQPVQNASIFHDLPNNSREYAESIKKLAIARSDAEGKFSVGELPAEKLTISAYHPDYQIASSEVTLVPGQTTPITLTLGSGGTLTGTVRLGGEPAGTGKRIVATRWEPEWRLEKAAIAQDGTYEIAGLAPGEVQVSVDFGISDKILQSGAGSRRIAKDALIAEGQTTVVDFDFGAADASLEGGVSIKGLPTQFVIPYLSITTPVGNQETLSFPPLQTGSGTYRLEGLPAGQADLRVCATSESGEKRTAHYSLTLEEGQAHLFDIDFTGGSTVEGNVSGLTAGEQCTLYLYSNRRVSPEELDKMLRTMNSLGGNADARTIVGADGSFRVQGLDAGDYTAVAFAAGAQSASLRHTVSTINLTEDRVTELHVDLGK